jgi:hypothetical protein
MSGTVLGQDPADAAADHELAVDHVAEAFERRPLAGAGPDAQALARSCDQ